MRNSVLIAALLLPLTACGGDVDGTSVTNERLDQDAVTVSTSPTPEDLGQNVEALEVAAQEQADRYAAGDQAAFWDGWTQDARSAVPEETWVAWQDRCGGGEGGTPLQVSDPEVERPGEGSVRVALDGREQTYDLRFEEGEWRWVPDARTLQTLSGATPEDLPACS